VEAFALWKINVLTDKGDIEIGAGDLLCRFRELFGMNLQRETGCRDGVAM
jgi:hypothetical protein